MRSSSHHGNLEFHVLPLRCSDVSYYDIASDSWSKIGDLPNAINTPVCDVDIEGGWYYCFTGWATGKFATKIKIEL